MCSTHCCLDVTEIWVKICSGNGLLPDSTKPKPEQMLTYHQWRLVTITWMQYHEGYLSHQLLKLAWELIFKNFIQISQGNMLMNIQIVSELSSAYDNVMHYTNGLVKDRYCSLALLHYRQTSNISCTKYQNLNVSHVVLKLSLCNL